MNRGHVEQYISALHGRAPCMVNAFDANPQEGEDVGGALFNLPDEHDALLDYLAEKNAAGRNVYLGINPLKSKPRYGKATKKNIVVTVDTLYVDADPKDFLNGGSYADARQLMLETVTEQFETIKPFLAVSSGNGIQAYFRLPKPVTHIEAEALGKALSAYFCGDHTQNVDRVFRVPGTTNFATPKKQQKYGYPEETQTELLSHTPEAVLSVAFVKQLMAEAKPSTPGTDDDAGEVPQYTPEQGVAIKKKFNALYKQNEPLRKRADGNPEGLKDTSNSGFDYAILNILKTCAWSASEAFYIFTRGRLPKTKIGSQKSLRAAWRRFIREWQKIPEPEEYTEPEWAREKEAQEEGNDDVFSLDQFAINDMIDEMELKMLEDKFLLGRVAILGQATVFYAKSGTGKTLLVMWLLRQAIEAGDIAPENVYYINADDNHKGLVEKGRIARKLGFKMVCPGYREFKTKKFLKYLQKLVEQDQAHGVVVILDTVKKFADLMSKTDVTLFADCVRQFVARGGTVVMNAHTNKHRDDLGNVIPAGVSDLIDDVDCAYTIDIVTSDDIAQQRTIKFINVKNRGDVALSSYYEYDFSPAISYTDKLNSVREIDESESKDVEKARRLDERFKKNRPAIAAIVESVNRGVVLKTDLIADAVRQSGISRTKITDALHEHTGDDPDEYQFWQVNKENKNAHVYKLNKTSFFNSPPTL